MAGCYCGEALREISIRSSRVVDQPVGCFLSTAAFGQPSHRVCVEGAVLERPLIDNFRLEEAKMRASVFDRIVPVGRRVAHGSAILAAQPRAFGISQPDIEAVLAQPARQTILAGGLEPRGRVLGAVRDQENWAATTGLATVCALVERVGRTASTRCPGYTRDAE